MSEREENQRITKGNAHNSPLIPTFRFNVDASAVTKEVILFLSELYGVDVLIPLFKNEVCEDWKKKIEDRYIINYEEVQILVMVPV